MKESNSSSNKRKPFIIGTIIFLLLVALTQFLAYQKYLIDKDNKRDEVLKELYSLKDRIKASLTYGLSASKTLAFIVENYGLQKNFDTLAKEILKSNKNIDALELTSKGVITNIYPLQGNENAIGYDVLGDTLRNKEAYAALKKREMYFAGPIELQQGGIGFVGRLPLFKNNNFIGFSVVLIKLATFLKGAGIDTLESSPFIYQISKVNAKTGKEEFFLPNVFIPDKTLSSSIEINEGDWTLSVSSKDTAPYFNALLISLLGFVLSIICFLFALSKLRQPEKLKKLVEEKNRLYEVISRINRVVISASSEDTLFTEVCKIAVEHGKFRMAWIGLVDEKDQKIIPVVYAGEENGYLKKIRSIVLGDNDLSNAGPTAKSINSGAYVCCNDIENDPTMQPWAEAALSRGYRSSISLPIKRSGKVIGNFSLYASSKNYFNQKEIELLQETSADISFTLENFENEKLRLLAEEEVISAYKDKETTLNRIKDSVVSLDNNWRYTFLNKPALAEHQDGIHDVLGKTLWEVHPGLKGTIFWDKYHEAMEGRNVVEFESFYAPMGLWFFVKVYPSEDGLTIFYNNITERKKADEQIRAEKLLSESIINSLPGIFYLYDDKGKFVRWNRNFEMVSGYSKDEIIRMHPLDFYDTDEKELMDKKIQSVFEKGHNDVEAFFFTKSGQKIPYYFNGYRIEFNNRNYLLGVGLDVTFRKEIEKELKENEEKYRLLFHTSPIATWMLSIPDYKIIAVNDSAINKYGYSREEFLRMDAKDILSEKEFDVFKTGMGSKKNTGTSFAGKWKHMKKNGDTLIAEVIAHDLTYGKECVRVVLANDITDRERAESELRQSEARLNAAQTVAKIGSWETHLPGLDLIWSAETFHIFEIEPKDFKGTHSDFLEFIHPDDRLKVERAFANSVTDKTVHSLEHRIITAGGSEKTVEERWQIIFNSEGLPIRAVGTCQDISDRKKNEALIQQSQIELRKLYDNLQNIREEERTGIAREIHDELGQQLTGLKMDSYWILKKLNHENAAIHEKITSMITLIDSTINTVRRISSELRPGILDDLGLLAALEWQGQEFEKRTGIKTIFRSTLHNFNPQKNLSTNMFRVFQEALTNIARHADATEVETLLEEKDGFINLSIRDNGQGFDKEEVKHKNSLGLMGMRERALLFKGELLVESQNNKGTRIIFRVPLQTINNPSV